MPINIINAKEHNEVDSAAILTAERWLLRIRELFITERSLQQSIGISEIGSDCRKCVARKLAGRPKKPEGSWFPFIGTAVHASLEDGFARWPDDYHLEERLHVFDYKSLKLAGSCDMGAYSVDGEHFIVNDWKVVGEKKIKEAAKGKVSDQYRIQAMLYGYGWEQLGKKVSHVSITFLPRDLDLQHAEVVMLRYDRNVATDALEAAVNLIDSAEIVGWDKVIEKQPKASFCWDCKKYEQDEIGDVSSLI
ncbi:MAG: hypothetical protein ACKOQ8_05575 [Micrococcales bacterium]